MIVTASRSSSMRAESTTSWLVSPAWRSRSGSRSAQGLDQGDHRVAAGLGVQLDVRYGETLADPGAFDDDHRLAKRLRR